MNSKKNILVTGANGQLGREFQTLAKQFTAWHFLFASKEDLSINDMDDVKKYFSENTIDTCINCAAYTAVDKAETEKEQAIAINATAVGNLAAVCKEHNAIFFHFSTDYVFNGKASKPYVETDSTDPANFYGHTKLLGELAAIENYEKSIIIRTSWVYSSYGKNFVKTMLRLMNERESISVVADQFGSPTYAADLAAAVMKIIDGNNFVPGIYHYCNEGIISWHEFATAIKDLSGSSCVVNPINAKAYPLDAKRPDYGALNTQKIKEQFGLIIPNWRKSLKGCMGKMGGIE